MLAEHLGTPVVDAGGARLGTIADLAVRLGPRHPPVATLEVRTGRHTARRIPWDAVASLDRSGARLRLRALELPDAPPAAGELLLRRDVLDVQIFDVGGKRLTRVGDVELVEEGGGLRLAAVDVGAAPILRRLGLGPLSRRARSIIIDWNELHIASGRGHALQLETPSAPLHALTPDELAELVARLPPERGSEVLEAVHPAMAAEALELQVLTPEARPRHRYGRILRLRRRAPS